MKTTPSLGPALHFHSHPSQGSQAAEKWTEHRTPSPQTTPGGENEQAKTCWERGQELTHTKSGSVGKANGKHTAWQ